MDLNIDELERIYEALNISMAEVDLIEAPRAQKEEIRKELQALKNKVDVEIQRQELLVKSSPSKG
jgi:hypothetical protein